MKDHWWDIWSIESGNLLEEFDNEEDFIDALKWYQENWGDDAVMGGLHFEKGSGRD